MNLNLTPVEVNIDIESLSLERDAFYNVCFIAEHDTAERHITVNVLKDLLDAGYTRDSLAYNFCVGVFAQQTMPQVFIRAKRASETYQQAYDAESNEGYYFIVIQSKDDSVISSFESHINSSGDSKLLFHSSNTNPLLNKKIVHYTHKLIDVDKDVTDFIYINVKDHYINKAYNLGYTTRDFDTLSSEDFQRARLAYPESAWIATCGNVFPSTVQWLYKYLAKVEVNRDKVIPNLSNTSSMVIDNKATVGSGTTTQGIIIHEQVSLDWVQWALSRKVWSTLYNNEKINATQGGLALIVNDAKQVLDVAIEEDCSEDDYSEYEFGDVEDGEEEYCFSKELDKILNGAFVVDTKYDRNKKEDLVNNPSHYNSDPSGVKCIEITRHRNNNIGNVIKYVWRNGLKDGNSDVQDLEKAAWYLNDEIQRLKGIE